MVRAQQDSLQIKLKPWQNTKSKKRQQAHPNSQKDGLWPWFIPPSMNVQGSNTLWHCNLTRRTLGVKPPSAFLDDGTTLSLNPGKMKSQGKKKWYVTSSRTHIKGSKSYQMNRVRERKRVRQTQCSRKMGQIAWTLILRDQNIPLGFEGDGASMCVPGSMHATKWWGRLTSLQNACCAQLLHEVPTTLT